MRKLIVPVLALNLLSANMVSTAYGAAEKIVATYNDIKVTDSQVTTELSALLDSNPMTKGKKLADFEKPMQENLIKLYINSKIVDSEAKKLQLTKSDSYKQKLKIMERRLLEAELAERQIKEKLNDKAIDAEYSKLAKKMKGQKEYMTAHILVDSETKAKEIQKKLKKGASFAELAKEHSNDVSTKNNGGQINYATKGNFVPEYEKVAFSLKKDEISTPVKTKFGWHVIKLVDSRDVKLPTRKEADGMLRQKLSQDIMQTYFSELQDKAKIELKI